MNKQFKALIVDIDGTILIPGSRHSLPTQRVTDALAKASELLHVGIATGRPIFLVTHITDHLKLSGPSIINDGAQVYDVTTNTTYYERVLDKEVVKEAYAILKKYTSPIFISDGDEDYELTDDFVPKKPLNIFTTYMETTLADELLEKLAEIPTIHAHKTSPLSNAKVEVLIAHAEATKQHGIFQVAKVLGITTDEIIGIGDGYNDFPLLMACGLKVAMGNAVPGLKEIADYVAPTVNEDGVAHVIEKFILHT